VTMTVLETAQSSPTDSPTELKWGILGTGNIAKTLARAINASHSGKLLAVGSRSQESADTFGAEFNVERRYDRYEKLLADPDVQAIYISLPNHLHKEWAIKSAQAGKHVMCEKPLTVNLAEAEELFAAVGSTGVFFMEAFQYRCHPMMAKVQELIQNGEIGDVKLIHASFQYNLGPKYENIRLSNPAAGGGIMDVGCYTMAFARLAAGAGVGKPFSEPTELKGTAAIGPISRVDEQAAAALKFPGDIVAYLACGTQLYGDRAAAVFGTTGKIVVPNPWIPSETGNKVLLYKAGTADPQEFVTDAEARGPYTVEADLLAQCVANKQTQAETPALTWEDSLGNMRALDMWRKEVGLVFDVEIAATSL
jgi:predicted dehydrogenase